MVDAEGSEKEFGSLPLRRLSLLLESGELSALELFESTLRAAERVRSLSAFVTIDPELGARQAAASDERRRRGEAGALDGVPMPIKDMEPTRGLRTTSGSRTLEHWVPDDDGGAASAVRHAGMNIFMKTNTTEFALTEQSSNPLGIVTKNPLDTRLTPGGSSAGAAAAVAAGVVPAAHGSDGAGSVRLPAALCGIVGFKPSYGVIPRHPISDQWGGRSHHGVLARTVDDVRVAMGAFARNDPRDPLTMQVGIRPEAEAIERAGLRFVALETWSGEYVDPEVRAAVLSFADRLSVSGFERLDPPQDTPDAGSIFENLYLPQLAYDVAQIPREKQGLIGEDAAHWVARAADVDLAAFMKARDDRGALNRWCCQEFAEVDFLVLPAQHRLAWLAAEARSEQPMPDVSIGRRLEFLAVFNLLGWPAISLPIGMSADGRAIGVQLVCRRGEDARLLDIAEAIGQVHGI